MLALFQVKVERGIYLNLLDFREFIGHLSQFTTNHFPGPAQCPSTQLMMIIPARVRMY
jgi:hypothetical protein